MRTKSDQGCANCRRSLEPSKPYYAPAARGCSWLRRPARTIGANYPEAVLQKAPVNRASVAKRVVHADDLVEPGSEQILLGLRRSVGRIPKDPLAAYDTTESSLALGINLQEVAAQSGKFWRIPILEQPRFPSLPSALSVLHGRSRTLRSTGIKSVITLVGSCPPASIGRITSRLQTVDIE